MKSTLLHFVKAGLKLTFLVCLLSIATQSKAAVYRTSTGSGNWSTGSLWSSSGSGSIIVYKIRPGDSVVLDVNASGFDTLIDNGVLYFNNSKTITLNTNGHILLGTYPIGSSGSGILSGGNGNCGFLWAGGTGKILGPFNGTNRIVGQWYANEGTAIAGSSSPTNSFLPLSGLPIVMSDFQLHTTATSHDISWKAEGIASDAKFIVYTSVDGRNYTEYSRINVVTEGGLHQYNASIAKTNAPMYIRLSIWENGMTENLKTVYANDGKQTVVANIFPTVLNSFHSSMNLVVPAAGDYTVQVISPALSIVGSFALTTNTNNEIITIDALSSGMRSSGIYYVLVTNAAGSVLKTPILVQE